MYVFFTFPVPELGSWVFFTQQEISSVKVSCATFFEVELPGAAAKGVIK